MEFIIGTAASVLSDIHDQPIMIPDGMGGWTSKAANEPCIGPEGLQTIPTRTNAVRNSSAAGGAAGVLPTYWTEFVGGLGTMTSIKHGVHSAKGLPVFRYQVVGTPASSNGTILRPDGSNQNTLAATVGRIVVLTIFLRRVAGDLSQFTTIRPRILERNSGGVLHTHYSGNLREQITDDLKRFTMIVTVTNAATTHVTLDFEMAYAAAVNATLDFGVPQLELGTFASPPILTSAGAIPQTGNLQVVNLAGKLSNGFAGFVRFNLKALPAAGTTPWLVLMFSDGTNNERVRIQLNPQVDGSCRFGLYSMTGGVETASVATLAAMPVAVGKHTLAFAAAPGNLFLRWLGDTQRNAPGGAYPTTMSQLSIGSRGFIADQANAFMNTEKLDLAFGTPERPVNQALFDQVYARAAA